jgi:hypothetical protein
MYRLVGAFPANPTEFIHFLKPIGVSNSPVSIISNTHMCSPTPSLNVSTPA